MFTMGLTEHLNGPLAVRVISAFELLSLKIQMIFAFIAFIKLGRKHNNRTFLET